MQNRMLRLDLKKPTFPIPSPKYTLGPGKRQEEHGPSPSLHMGASSSLLLSLVLQDVDSHLILITPSGVKDLDFHI